VRVPYFVPAGEKFPVAVFAAFSDCIDYGGYDSVWEYGSSDIEVRLRGILSLFQGCPSCLFTHLGIIWMNGLPPGTYSIQVGDFPAQQLIVGNGAAPEPECQEDCPPPLGDGWSVTDALIDTPPALQCGPSSEYSGIDLYFDGECHDYTVHDGLLPLVPTPEVPILHCTDTDLMAEVMQDFQLVMTRCAGAAAQTDELLLGLASSTTGEAAMVVLLEK